MNITRVLNVILDSSEKQYKGLFEPFAEVEWINQDVYDTVFDGVSFYHSAACFPYFEMQVEVHKKTKFLQALLQCMQNHKREVDKDVSVYFNKDEESLTEDEWEVNNSIHNLWGIDDYGELLTVQASLDNLVNNIRLELTTRM